MGADLCGMGPSRSRTGRSISRLYLYLLADSGMSFEAGWLPILECDARKTTLFTCIKDFESLTEASGIHRPPTYCVSQTIDSGCDCTRHARCLHWQRSQTFKPDGRWRWVSQVSSSMWRTSISRSLGGSMYSSRIWGAL